MLDFNIGVGFKLFWKNIFFSPPWSVKILYQSWLILVQEVKMDVLFIYLI